MLWNRKLHYRAHKSPRLVPIPSQRHRVTLSHTFLVVHYHIILPSTPSSFKCSFSLLNFLWSITILSSHLLLALSSGPFLHFPTPKLCTFILPRACYTSRPPHPYFIWSPSEANYMQMWISSWRHRLVQCVPAQKTATSRTKGRSCKIATERHNSEGLGHHTPIAGSSPATHNASEYTHAWATMESLNVAMMPLLPLPRNDVRHDTYRQHFIQGTTAIRDGILIQRNSWVTQCAVF
jgi:hypothetical protein